MCVMHQPIKLIPFIDKLVWSPAASVAFLWTVCAVPLCDVLSISKCGFNRVFAIIHSETVA